MDGICLLQNASKLQQRKKSRGHLALHDQNSISVHLDVEENQTKNESIFRSFSCSLILAVSVKKSIQVL